MVEIENLENLLGSGRDSALLRFTLGSAFIKYEQYSKAIEHLEKAIQMQADYSAAWKLYGRALEKNGSLDEAINAYRKGIAVANENGDIQAAREMGVFLKRLKA